MVLKSFVQPLLQGLGQLLVNLHSLTQLINMLADEYGFAEDMEYDRMNSSFKAFAMNKIMQQSGMPLKLQHLLLHLATGMSMPHYGHLDLRIR